MKRKIMYALVFGLMASSIGGAQARSWTDAQTEVWEVILESYKDIDARDVNWSDKWVFSDAMVWGPDYPMPRNRDSVKRWDAYQFSGGKNHLAEYSPAAIVVHESTAGAHYYTSSAVEDREGKHKTSHGRCTDILARDGERWKFIAWHCGDEPGGD